MYALGQAIWGDIWEHTVEKSPTNATNVTIHLPLHIIWGCTWKRTVEKSQINAASVTIHHIMQAIWGFIWKHTLGKSRTNVTNVILHPLRQAIWRDIWERTVEKSQTNATNVSLHPLTSAIWGSILRSMILAQSQKMKCNQLIQLSKLSCAITISRNKVWNIIVYMLVLTDGSNWYLVNVYSFYHEDDRDDDNMSYGLLHRKQSLHITFGSEK